MKKSVRLSPYQVPSHIREKLRELGEKKYGSQTKALIVAVELLYEREIAIRQDLHRDESGQ